MERWFDEDVKPSGFGAEKAWQLRDLPHLGIVVSVCGGESGQPTTLSTWDRRTRRRIRCRVSRPLESRRGIQGSRQEDPLPTFAGSGSLLYYLQYGTGPRPGTIVGLTHDALQSERCVDGLPGMRDLEGVTISPDGRTVQFVHHQHRRWTRTIACLETGEALWRDNGDSRFREEETFEFSPCSRLALMWTETNVQSGSDRLSFELREARTGTVVMSDETSVYAESLQFSGDSREILLQASDSNQAKIHWSIPDRGQPSPTDRSIAPPAVATWEKIFTTLETA